MLVAITVSDSDADGDFGKDRSSAPICSLNPSLFAWLTGAALAVGVSPAVDRPPSSFLTFGLNYMTTGFRASILASVGSPSAFTSADAAGCHRHSWRKATAGLHFAAETSPNR